jgi:hypothetical protein
MIFEKNVIEYKIYVLISSTTFLWNIRHFKKNLSDIWSKMSNGLHVNYQ